MAELEKKAAEYSAKVLEITQFNFATRLFGDLTFREVFAWAEVPQFTGK